MATTTNTNTFKYPSEIDDYREAIAYYVDAMNDVARLDDELKVLQERIARAAKREALLRERVSELKVEAER